MNYEKHLVAFCVLGETGNSIVIVKQHKKRVHALKLFSGGNENVVIPKKLFKQLISRGDLEDVGEMPTDIFKEFKITWENNNNKETLENETPVS